jgi:hypothetical protein
MSRKAVRSAIPALALSLLAESPAWPSEGRIEVRDIDSIIRNNPLSPGCPTVSIVEFIRAGGSEIGVLVMSKNRLHHHQA